MVSSRRHSIHLLLVSLLVIVLITSTAVAVSEDQAFLICFIFLMLSTLLMFFRTSDLNWKLYALMILALPFYRIGALPLPLFKIFAAQSLILLLMVRLFFKRISLANTFQNTTNHPLLVPLSAFFIILLLSVSKSAWIPENFELYPLINRSGRNIPYLKSITQVFWVAIGVVAFLLTVTLVNSKKFVIRAVRLWLYSQLITSLFSIVQTLGYYLGIDAISGFFKGVTLVHGLNTNKLEKNVLRVTSVFTEPSHLSVFHITFIPLVFVAISGRFSFLGKRERQIFFLLLVFSFIMTMSRTTMLLNAFLLFIGLVSLVKSKIPQSAKIRALLYGLVTLLIIEASLQFGANRSIIDVVEHQISTLSQQGNISNYSRTLSLTTAWKIFLQNPILGVGTGNFAFHIASIVNYWDLEWVMPIVGNIYIEILVETGILGFIAFAWILIVVWSFCRNAQKQTTDPELKTLLSSLMVGYYGMLIGFTTFSAFFFPFVWAYIGLMIVTAREANKVMNKNLKPLALNYKHLHGLARERQDHPHSL